MHMYILKSDGSIEDRSRRVIHFSVQRFKSEICKGNNCFVCGKTPQEVEFNNEHILPKWILRDYNLFKREIGLPNLIGYKYGKYVIPCCRSCNTLMNDEIEKPIKRLLSKGYTDVIEYIKINGPWLFFNWLALIFIKTHLKDKMLKYDLKTHNDDTRISDLYNWEELYHVHCIARSFYTKAEIKREVMGSFIVVPSKVRAHFESFDYADLNLAQTIMLRLSGITFLCVLNDSTASQNNLAKMLNHIDGELSPLQIRELMVRLAYANVKLKIRPQYFSDIDTNKEKYTIGAWFPPLIKNDEYVGSELGNMLFTACKPYLPKGFNSTKEADYFKNGAYTYLFDSDKKFIKNSMEML